MFLKSTCNIDFLEMIKVIVIVHPKRFSHVGGMIKRNNGLVVFKGQMFILFNYEWKFDESKEKCHLCKEDLEVRSNYFK